MLGLIDSARAGYGFIIIRSNKQTNGWGHFEYTMSGRGMVEGNNLSLTQLELKLEVYWRQ